MRRAERDPNDTFRCVGKFLFLEKGQQAWLVRQLRQKHLSKILRFLRCALVCEIQQYWVEPAWVDTSQIPKAVVVARMRLGGDEAAVEEDGNAPCASQLFHCSQESAEQPFPVRRRREPSLRFIQGCVMDSGGKNRPWRRTADIDKVRYHQHNNIIVCRVWSMGRASEGDARRGADLWPHRCVVFPSPLPVPGEPCGCAGSGPAGVSGADLFADLSEARPVL